jgi:uncharacterized protein YqeY
MIEKLRTQIAEAMKAGDKTRMSILRVFMGELQKANITTEGPEATKIARKLVESNNEAIDIILKKWENTPGQSEKHHVFGLQAENKVLQEFLPTYLSKDEIKVALQPMLEQIKGCKSSGQATGVAMKHLKDRPVEGGTVKQAIEELRQ